MLPNVLHRTGLPPSKTGENLLAPYRSTTEPSFLRRLICYMECGLKSAIALNVMQLPTMARVFMSPVTLQGLL
jgi:hypothetical protein